MGSALDAPPGGPYVHTIGGNAAEQPREMANPWPGYGTANKVSTADGEATVPASGRLAPAQASTRRAAAASGEDWGALGAHAVVGGVVRTVVGATEVEGVGVDVVETSASRFEP
jgi:hypothetical protein